MKTLFLSFTVVCLCSAMSQGVVSQQPAKTQRAQKKAVPTQKKPDQPAIDKAPLAKNQQPVKKGLKIEKIGVIFANFSSWGEGRWELSFSRENVEKELLEALRDKSSKSARKLEVIKVRDMEDAQAQGIQIVYSLDYREESGGYKDFVMAAGTCTDILCAFKRADQSDLVTDWDNLSITKRCKEIKVEQKSAEQGNLQASIRAAGVYAEELMRGAVFRLAFVLGTSLIPEFRAVKSQTSNSSQKSSPPSVSQPPPPQPMTSFGKLVRVERSERTIARLSSPKGSRNKRVEAEAGKIYVILHFVGSSRVTNPKFERGLKDFVSAIDPAGAIEGVLLRHDKSWLIDDKGNEYRGGLLVTGPTQRRLSFETPSDAVGLIWCEGNRKLQLEPYLTVSSK